jgi:hypothetical protein
MYIQHRLVAQQKRHVSCKQAFRVKLNYTLIALRYSGCLFALLFSLP